MGGGSTGDSERNENTNGSRCSSVDSNRTWERKGSESKLVVGNSEEVIKGCKWCWSCGFINDLYVGSKNEQIFGVEFKNVNGNLSEAFLSARAEIVAAIGIELTKGPKREIVSAGRLRLVNDEQAKSIEEDRAFGVVQQMIGSALTKAKTGHLNVTSAGTEAVTNHTSKVDALRSEINTYSLEFASQKWDGTNSTVKTSGAYRVESSIFHVKATGSASIKGSNITAAAGGSTLVCAGGKVKLNKHLVVG